MKKNSAQDLGQQMKIRTQAVLFDAECRNCMRKGHYTRRCRTARGVNEIQDDSTDDDPDNAFLGEIKFDSNSVDNEWRETLELNGKEKEFKLYTGARVKAIPKHQFNSIQFYLHSAKLQQLSSQGT